MIGKILLLLTALVGAFLIIRFRMRRAGSSASPSSSGRAWPSRRLFLWGAYVLVALMLVGSALYLYLDWRTQEEVIQVRVVNIYTGENVRYEARRRDVGWRRLTTLEGRQVTLAEVERLEIDEPR
jgi:hypothetical protein